MNIRFQASRAHVLKAATDYIRNIKTKNQQHRKSIEELKQQNALFDLQSRSKDVEAIPNDDKSLAFLSSSATRTRQRNRSIHSTYSSSTSTATTTPPPPRNDDQDRAGTQW
jgi:hypothetical protein